MDSLHRLLPLSADEFFAAFQQDNDHAHSAVEHSEEWGLLLRHCEALLKEDGFQPSLTAVRRVASQLIQVSNICYRAGFTAGVRDAARLQARAARAAKRQKAISRAKIVRQAILMVCDEQRLWPTASDKFALSIQADVVDVTRRLGLSDVSSGMSSRSIQRHIAALQKHKSMR